MPTLSLTNVFAQLQNLTNMAYLTKADLTTHLYWEVLTEITRENTKEYATLAAFPVTGFKRYQYKDLSSGKYYVWDGDTYNETQFVGIIDKAINAGIDEAKSYLNRYDLEAMFSNDDTKRTFQNDYLDSLVKDLIMFHLTKLANANASLEDIQFNYKAAIKTFEQVMKGLTDPPWPLRQNNPNTSIDESGNVSFVSNTKRRNSY